VARLAFLGSPPAAVAALRALVDAGHDVAMVVSRADARRGRGTGRSPSAVKQAAVDLGLPVTDRLDDVTGVGAELGVVVAYGRIVPRSVLDALPMVNVHFSLLPRWRGAAPVERAVLAGDSDTGVCLMRLEEGLDTGPVVSSVALRVGEGEHVSPLRDRLAVAGAELLVEALAHGVDAMGPGEPQRGEPTYADKVRIDELRLDWTRPAVDLERVVRLDRAWTTVGGRRLLVLDAVAHPDRSPPGADAPGELAGTEVRTGEGVLELVVVQPAGRTPLRAAEWRRGLRRGTATRLGDEEADR